MREFKVSTLARCKGKKLFTSFEFADKVAKESRRREGRDDENYHAYHCIPCNGFHVGGMVGRIPGKPRAEA